MLLRCIEERFGQMSAVIMWLALASGGGSLIIGIAEGLEDEGTASWLQWCTVWQTETRAEAKLSPSERKLLKSRTEPPLCMCVEEGESV